MSPTSQTRNRLAIQGGSRTVVADDSALFHWPIVTSEDEQAVLAVLRDGTMSAVAITREFEAEWARYIGARHALASCNGTTAIQTAMWALGVARGDEVIVPSITYWASALPLFSLGATPVFADVQPDSLCLDPEDFERKITRKTRAVVVVHYCGHPADMDRILAVARKHKLKVLEDCSHSHGTLYKGRMTGTFGDAAGFSMMGGKSFAIGEGGMLTTDSREVFERAVSFSAYERIGEAVSTPELARLQPKTFATALPLGGVKGRLNQTCAAMGRVQLKYYPRRIVEIQSAMNRFWDLLDGVPGLRPHRPEKNSGSTMGGWYNPLGHYLPEELGGLPVEKFITAVNAEGGRSGRGVNFPLHLHPVLNEADVYRDGKPTRTAFSDRDVRQPPGSLPVSEALGKKILGIPYFKHDRPEAIERYAAAFRKVALQADDLL